MTLIKLENFDVLLTVHLSIFISVFNQLDAQNLFHNMFYSFDCVWKLRISSGFYRGALDVWATKVNIKVAPEIWWCVRSQMAVDVCSLYRNSNTNNNWANSWQIWEHGTVHKPFESCRLRTCVFGSAWHLWYLQRKPTPFSVGHPNISIDIIHTRNAYGTQ